MAGDQEIVWEDPGGAPRRFQPAAIAVVAIVAILTVIGLSVLFSASQGMHEEATFLLGRQIRWLLIALAGCLFFTFLPLERLEQAAPVVLVASLLGLVLVLIPGIGVTVNGAQRWIDLAGQRLQPSEFAKFGLTVGVAAWFARYQRLSGTFVLGFLIPSVVLSFFVGLILLQPDFGTAGLCGLTAYCLFFLGGSRLRYLIPAAILGIVLISVLVYLDPVRLERITAFLDPEGNRSDGAYQLMQSIIALGAGGLTGVGIGNGRQQNEYLPEAHTDFIFSIVGEEMGLLATGSVVLLFTCFFLLGVQQMRKAPNVFEALMFAGALFFITFQSLINLGVVTGLLPTKGMSLPFISYGGSNLVVVYSMLGVILNGFRSWNRPALERARFL